LVHGRRKDGSLLLAEVALSPLLTLEGPVTLGVVVDVSEREALLHQLEAQTVELRRSNDELSQFAYVASHDLQEPLRMVASFAELLDERSRAHLDEKGLKYLGYITEGARRMQQLVRDLLTYSRLGTQGRPLAPVDLSRVAARVIEDLTLLIRSTGAVVEVGPLPRVMGDEGQLAQVLQNLIGNALKFRGVDPPRVSIAAERADELWRVTVADNGIGMDMKYHDRVFEMFQRLHGRGQFEGSGIGLAIVRRIVQRHLGTVWFESTPGAGTRFFFTLPPA
jgi:light-regulated signal transduction histidine kinase (bacteriophytochrome)